MTDEFNLDVEVLEAGEQGVIVKLDSIVSSECQNGHVGCAFQKAYQKYVYADEPDNECLVDEG